MTQTYILSAIVENKPGVLFRVSSMIRRRGFNIESVTVGTLKKKDLSRMTLAIRADEGTIENLAKQLRKLIDVLQVSVLEAKNTVAREMALVKLAGEDAKLIMEKASAPKCRIIDSSLDHVVLEVTGTSEQIDSFLEIADSSRVKEFSRTGITALARD